MTATVVAFRPSGRGRQSAEVEALRDARDELTAVLDEGAELASLIVAVSRRAQVALGRGWSPANHLDELERLGLRHAARMAAASAQSNAGASCPDGVTVRHIGHGHAA